MTREHSQLGIDHCNAGLHFNKTGTERKRKYVIICRQWSSWIQTCKTGDQSFYLLPPSTWSKGQKITLSKANTWITNCLVLSFYFINFRVGDISWAEKLKLKNNNKNGSFVFISGRQAGRQAGRGHKLVASCKFACCC